MPQKLSAASRPQARSWGTRFDQLSTSPPLSPVPDVAPGPAFRSEPRQRVSSGEDKKESKMPHDASVFVGSLPAQFEQNELAQLLSEHLAEHAEVKYVKVVRDVKGGVCAFVQCEDAAAAETLINALHAVEPRPFFGRTLRFERARAFRTLLISYRRPTQYILDEDTTTANQPAARHHVALDLPTAMRLYRPKSARSVDIVYNVEAHIPTDTDPNAETQDNSLGLYMAPLAFDENAIHRISTFFGALESFGRYRPASEHGYHPYPHDAPRDPVMDPAIFEIKWNYRDDCVSALKALRRVPHLTVTWAHQPPPSQRGISHGFESYPLYIQPMNIHGNYSARDSRVPGAFETSASGHYDPSPSTPSSKSWTNSEFPALPNQQAQGKLDWFEDEFIDTQRRTPIIDEVQVSASPERLSMARLTTAPRDPSSSHEGSLSHTPTSARSPVTPWTPGSVFPPTPTLTSEFPSRSDLSAYEADHAEKIIDPTSIFVGGLDMQGPNVWDERNIHQLFGKYGSIQSIKLVRPLQGRSSFAFVKFHDVESPMRAVQGENNKIYDSRPIRVKLREYNPTRSSAARSREKSSRPGPRSTSPPSFSLGHNHDDRTGVPGYVYHPDSGISASESSQPVVHVQHRRSASLNHSSKRLVHPLPPTTPSHVLQDSFNQNKPSPQAAEVGEKYREWYEIEAEPAVSHAVPPNAAQPPFQHNAAQGYYGPIPPWMPAYTGAQPPFPAPYMVPHYPLPGQVPSRNYSPTGDVDIPASAQVWQAPHNMYGYMPYAFAQPPLPNDPSTNGQHSQLAATANFARPEQASMLNTPSESETSSHRSSPAPVVSPAMPPWFYMGSYRPTVAPNAGTMGWFPGNVAQANAGFVPVAPHPQQFPVPNMPIPGFTPTFPPQLGLDNGVSRSRPARQGSGHRGRAPHPNGRQPSRRGQSHINHVEQQMMQIPPEGWNQWVASTTN